MFSEFQSIRYTMRYKIVSLLQIWKFSSTYKNYIICIDLRHMNSYLDLRVHEDLQNGCCSSEVSLISCSFELNTYVQLSFAFYSINQTLPNYTQFISLFNLNFDSLKVEHHQSGQSDGLHHYHLVTSYQNTNHKAIIDNFILIQLKFRSYN